MAKKVILPKLLWYQKAPQKALLDKETKYVIMNFSRRIGKSFLCKNMVVHWALSSKCTIGYVVPSFDLAKKFLREMITTMQGSGVVASSNAVDKVILFCNGSQIVFHTAAEGAFSRGSGYDYLIFDEAAFFSQSCYEAVYKAYELQAKKVLIVSTPFGVGGMFYEMFHKGKAGDSKRYKSFECTLEESGLYDEQTIKEIRDSTTSAIYAQEFECQFVSGGISAFGEHYKQRITSTPAERTKNLYAGIDFSGATGGADSTILTIVNERCEVVAIYSWQYGNTQTLEEIAQLLELYNAQTLGEANSMGDISIEIIKKKYKRITPFTTTNESKRNIIENLIRNFEQGKGSILLSPHIDVEIQFASFVSARTPSGKITYRNINDHVHDDAVISLALACWSCRQFSKKGNYNLA